MDRQERERLHDDLRGLVKGDVLFDDVSRVLYSTDASIFQVEPLGVVAPRDEADVSALVRYAAENRVPLVPRGAGSGVAGESLGPGLIVDLSRHMRGVPEVGADTVRVQPGVVLRDLNGVLAREGRRLGPDPSSAAQCTIGGMLATNASGSRALRHGTMRDHVASLRVVLDSGDAVAASRHPLSPLPETRPGRREDIVASVGLLLRKNAALIREHQPRTPFNRCGYLLDGVFLPGGTGCASAKALAGGAAAARPSPGGQVDLARLLVGSEGTLGLFTEATLRTVPLPGGRAAVLAAFARMDLALRAARVAGEAGAVACELIDRRLLILIRGGDPASAALIPAAAEAALLIEFEADTPAVAKELAEDLSARIFRHEPLAQQASVAATPVEVRRFWELRDAALPSLYGLRGSAQPVAFVEDVGVPSESLGEFLHQVQDILRRHETTASFLVHALTGQVHTRPFLDLRNPADLARLLAIADEMYTAALDLGGTISAQHGTGLARTPWVPRQFGKLYPVLRELKHIFDPRHIFNPGKIIDGDGDGDGDGTAWPIRWRVESGTALLSGPDPEPSRHAAGPNPGLPDKAHQHTVEADPDNPGADGGSPNPARPGPLLRWAPDERELEAGNCNGCGLCRTGNPAERMCPIFRATHAEAATPRAKANLLRHLLRPGADPAALAADEVREVADLCVNCKMCAVECPAHVDVPRLMLEAKAHNVLRHGLHRSDWVLARIESFVRTGSGVAPLVNLALGSPGVRWLLEKLFGLSRRRRLPRFARRNFLRRARRRGWTRRPHPSRPRVAYFVDLFATYHDPSVAEAVVAVLHHNGIEVYVPPGQLSCGMAPLAQGDLEAARDIARHNLRLLADLAREGCPVLCSEPTAAFMLKHDALDLLDDPDARAVAEATVEFTAFLWDLHEEGRLRTDFRPLDLSVGHHVPCHLKALGRPPAGPRLLALIPGLRVHTIDVSCSGMAGTFGLKAENYELSREAGRPMLEELRRPRILHGSTECGPCRMQMEDGGGKRTLHPAQYLALAYGLMPDLARRLHEPLSDLVL